MKGRLKHLAVNRFRVPHDVPELKQIAREMFRDALAAIDVPDAMRQKLVRTDSRLTAGEIRLDLAVYNSIRAVAIGKAAVPMARGLTDLLAPDIALNGILVAPHDSLAFLRVFTGFDNTHHD